MNQFWEKSFRKAFLNFFTNQSAKWSGLFTFKPAYKSHNLSRKRVKIHTGQTDKNVIKLTQLNMYTLNYVHKQQTQFHASSSHHKKKIMKRRKFYKLHHNSVINDPLDGAVVRLAEDEKEEDEKMFIIFIFFSSASRFDSDLKFIRLLILAQNSSQFLI